MRFLRNIVVVVMVLISIQSAFAQNRFIDSIHNKLLAAQADTQRVEYYGDLCFYYRYVNIDSAIYYGHKSYDLSVAVKFLRGQAWALNNLGLAYREKGDLSKSLELQFKALKICNDHQFIAERGLCYRRIGLIYMDLNNFVLARDYHLKAVKDHEAIDNKRYLAIEFQNLARIYTYNNNIDSSRYYMEKARVWMNYAVDLYPDYYGVLAQLELMVGDNKKAIQAVRDGTVFAKEFSDYRNLCNLYLYAANIYYAQQKMDSALISAKQSVAYGQKINFKLGLFKACSFLAKYLEASDPAQALYYLKLANSAKESLFGAGNIQLMQDLVARENQRQSELENTEKAYRDRLKIYGLAIGIIFLSVLLFFLYRNSRQQKQVNALLLQQKQEIEKTLSQLKSTQQQLIQSEKMASLGELTAGIAHEIQNPLNFVNNFSEVSGELIDEMNGALEKGDLEDVKVIASDIQQNLSKIAHHGKRADSIVKGMLQHSRSSTGQKELTDINALCDEYLRLSYHGLRAKDSSFNAGFETHFDKSVGSISVVPQEIGRILLNLLNNAFYAVNEKAHKGIEGYAPKVVVRTEKLGSNIRIVVEDNGMGIPESIKEKIFQPFFTTKPTGQGTGLGLSLSYDIVKAHGGQLQCESKDGQYTIFRIQLPLA